MLEVPVYNITGEKVDTVKVDESLFGSKVNVALLKQAVVAYHSAKRRGTASTKSRGMVDGSTRKLFRQKGTGSARRGSIRANILRGGGVTFAKIPHSFRKKLPRKMRRAALDSAILAKILGQDMMIVDGLKVDEPKTSKMAQLLKNLQVNRSCLLALDDRDQNIYLSSRNIADLTVRVTYELNAFEVVTRQKMLVTSEAMSTLMKRESAK